MRAARERYRQMAPVLDEQSRRRYAAMEALSMGHGGVSAMSRITGLARSTINRGVSDIRNGVMAPPGRVRKAGGGRRRKIDEDPTLLSDLNRDSPDDCRSAVDIHAFPAFLQDRARCRRLPAPWAARTLLDGLTWPFSLAFGRTPPIGCR